jgi:hypothetical protein
MVPLACLPIERIISHRADDTKGGEAPGQVRGCLTYAGKRRTALIVQIFYSCSESVTRGAKGRVSLQVMWRADTDQFFPSELFNLNYVLQPDTERVMRCLSKQSLPFLANDALEQKKHTTTT